jgi:hypothetical protein
MPLLAIVTKRLFQALRRPVTVLAIVERELRVAARRPATYRIRSGAMIATLALITWKLFSFASQGAPVSQQGRSLFITLSVLAFAYCLLAGVRATSDCISEEKREGTLGLLFLTDLKGIDVVLGKLTATSLNSLYGLLAIFPALAIPLVLGGVTLLEFGQMVLVLGDTLFFSLSMGLLVSAVSRNERKAASGTVAAVLAPTFVPLALLLFASWLISSANDPLELDPLVQWLVTGGSVNALAAALFGPVLLLQLFNPVFALLCILFANTALPGLPRIWTSSQYLLLSLGLIHLLSWIALLKAARILPKIWKDRPASMTLVGWRERWLRFSQGTAEIRQKFRAELLGVNPFYWLIGRDRLKPHYAWLFVLSMAGVWLWRYVKEPDVMFDFYPLIPTIVIIHTFLKVWVVAESSQKLIEDQRSGALELLLSTPMTVQEIVQGQLLALKRQFALPLGALCLLELLVFSSHYSAASVLLVQTMLLADIFTLMWVSMWLSLSARSLNHVILFSVGVVLIAPWGIFMSVLGYLERLPTARDPAAYESGIVGLLFVWLSWLAVWLSFRRPKLDQFKWLLTSLAAVLPGDLQFRQSVGRDATVVECHRYIRRQQRRDIEQLRHRREVGRADAGGRVDGINRDIGGAVIGNIGELPGGVYANRVRTCSRGKGGTG